MNVSVHLVSWANGLISNQRNVPDWPSEEYGHGFYAICSAYVSRGHGEATADILTPDYLPLKRKAR